MRDTPLDSHDRRPIAITPPQRLFACGKPQKTRRPRVAYDYPVDLSSLHDSETAETAGQVSASSSPYLDASDGDRTSAN